MSDSIHKCLSHHELMRCSLLPCCFNLGDPKLLLGSEAYLETGMTRSIRFARNCAGSSERIYEHLNYLQDRRVTTNTTRNHTHRIIHNPNFQHRKPSNVNKHMTIRAFVVIRTATSAQYRWPFVRRCAWTVRPIHVLLDHPPVLPLHMVR